MEGKKIGSLPVIILLISLLVVSVLFYKLAFAYYQARYTEGAHAAVNRSTISGYAVGNCVHCHDPHASTAYDFGLFYSNNPTSQDDNFCFQCHKDSGLQIDGITNYTYSKNFGGGTADSNFNSIYEAFNPPAGANPSSHNLADVQTHAIGRSIGFTSDTNACVVCHDPHRAQDNHPVASTGKGGVYTAVSLPLHHKTFPRNLNLWGDEDLATSGFSERMIEYTTEYRAPYYKGGTNREPANDAIEDGSNLPNFNKFCLNNCHNATGVSSTEHGNLTKIDWGVAGNQHGRNHYDQGNGTTKAPYGDDTFNYVLACTDCHEPHGSPNEWLLRTCVNGKDNISVPGPGRWLDFCTACHIIIPHHGSWDTTTNCYLNGVCHEHLGATDF